MKYEEILELYLYEIQLGKRIAEINHIKDLAPLKQMCFDWYQKLLGSCENQDSYLEKVEPENTPTLGECEYLYTYIYRGEIIDVFLDDYGQQYIFVVDKEEYSCGAYNTYIKDDIMYIVDKKLDEKLWREVTIKEKCNII